VPLNTLEIAPKLRQNRFKYSATVAVTASERARIRTSDDEWLNPTLLASAFDAGDVEKAQDLASQVSIEGPSAWKLETTVSDCRTAAQLYEEPRRSELLEVAVQLEALLPAKPTATNS
jgi:hypothetical protein